MTHNIMKKRLYRNYKITPREARIVLRECNYNYEMAERLLIQRGLLSCRISIEDLCEGIRSFTNICIKVGNALGEAFAAFGKTFSEVMNRDE